MEKLLNSKLLRTGVSLALLVGILIPVTNGFADDIENEEEISFIVKDKPAIKDYENVEERGTSDNTSEVADVAEDKEITITYHVYSFGFPLSEIDEHDDFDISKALLVATKTETIKAVTGTPVGCDVRTIIKDGAYTFNVDEDGEYLLWEEEDTGWDVSIDLHFIPDKKYGAYEEKTYCTAIFPCQFEISYSGVDGLDNPNPTKYTVEDDWTLQPVEKEGYTFVGWFDENGNQVTDTGTKTGGLKLTAKFEAISYDIEYNGVDGLDNPNPTTYTVDKSIVLQPVEKEGYTFIGWFDEDGNQVTDTGTKTGGLKLTAKFVINGAMTDDNGKVTIIDENGEELTITVTWDDDGEEKTAQVGLKDAIISIENGKIKVELPKEIKTAITVNVSNELGGVEGKEVVCVWKDTQVFDIATDADGNATWKYVSEENNTNAETNQSGNAESGSSLPQTGDMTFYALLTSLFASVFSASVFGRKRMMEKKLGNRKH